jgi:photosystem II stability/assembly factor-like uncharacterized protein
MFRIPWVLLIALTLLFCCDAAIADDDKDEEEKNYFKSGTFSGLKFREIGPALTSGRIGDFAVDPDNPARYFVAVCCGGVWRTENSGTTYESIFDGEVSYSIGCVTLDPKNPNVVWVGTGENNSQRSVGYGDGLYKSVDGGDSWKLMGLESSEHIAKILIDPRDSNIVYVAAQGPLWNSGGDRGLYKTYDGGLTWDQVLYIDENTGITDIVMDPRDPNVIYAASYQRRRHIWVLLDGGPGSGIHKTTDGGKTWTELENGLPDGDMGRIGLAISPVKPDIVYAIVEATDDESGFYRSTNRGISWDKRNSSISTSPQYYQEIFADPVNPDKVFSLNTVTRVTYDGGKTWERYGRDNRHVDDHALWIDPDRTEHVLIGGDGGIYETWDDGANWHYKTNMPVTQFYRVCVDNDTPFYNIYGGTQDNNTLGGPSRTINCTGIINTDWYITQGGDGFEPQVDPQNPDIVYSQSQYGGLTRYDRKSGENVELCPQGTPDDPPDKWNWNAPILISPHKNTRLYYASQRLWRTEDRGDSWTPISGDLTRQIDRNKLEVMGRVWSIDAVAKNRSTSIWGSIVFIAESPRVEHMLYVGTDDGLVQYSPDGGETWIKRDKFKDVPEQCLVSCVTASFHDDNTVYASFDNHKKGDYLPYIVKSTNNGKNWQPIAGNLPERGSVHSIVEDHIRPGLLFVGTEFGVFFTVDDGETWVQLKSGIPPIAMRDLDIQRRENDLVVGSFGRGFYVLDDYTPLRKITPEFFEQRAAFFPIKKSWMFFENSPHGWGEKGAQGASFWSAKNPPVGAVFTYYIKEGHKKLRQQRRSKEKEIAEEGGDVFYPTWEELRAEEREKDAELLLTIRDADGNVVRHITGKAGSGIHRVDWDFRYPAPNPVNDGDSGWWKPTGPLATPGTYTVTMSLTVGGESNQIAGPESFEIEPLGLVTLPAEDKQALLAFQQKTARLQRAVLGARKVAEESQTRINALRKALYATPAADPVLFESLDDIETKLKDLNLVFSGDRLISKHEEAAPTSIRRRVSNIVSGSWNCTSKPTKTQTDDYAIASRLFVPVLDGLRRIAESDLVEIERELEAAGAPWTPGRVPVWSPE